MEVEGEGEWVSPLFASMRGWGWGWKWIESWGHLGSFHNWRDKRVEWDEKMEIINNNNFLYIYNIT